MKTLTNITVFPSTKTQTINKLITENSLTRIINRLINTDGYIITTTLEKLGEDIDKDIISTKFTVNDIPLEFSIKGYYFSIDSLTTLLSDSELWETNNDSWKNTEHKLFARIFIDKTVQSYPELMGQYSQTPVVQPIEGFVSGETAIENFMGKDITQDVVLLDSNSKIISKVNAVTVNSEGKISCSDFTEGHAATDVAFVQYTKLTFYEGLQVYVLDKEGEQYNNSPAPTPPNNVAYSENLHDYYDLELLHYYKPDHEDSFETYIPLRSMHRFTSASIRDIDGGEIK